MECERFDVGNYVGRVIAASYLKVRVPLPATEEFCHANSCYVCADLVNDRYARLTEEQRERFDIGEERIEKIVDPD